MAITKLSVSTIPDYIYVGETINFNIETDGEITSVAITPPNVVSVNETKTKITGLRPGSAQLLIKAKRSGCEETTLVVNLRCRHKNTSTVSIMMHNRETNRVSSIRRQENTNMANLIVGTPKNGTGTLVTRDSLIEKFNLINKPIIMIPSNGETNCTGWIYASKYSTNLGFEGDLECSVWEYYSDFKMTDLLDTRYVNRAHEIDDGAIVGDKTKGPIIHTNTTVYVRVKYVSGSIESPWSDLVQINCGDTTKDSKKTLLKGNGMLGYYGVVPHSECIDDVTYRGDYDIISTYPNFTLEVNSQVNKGDTLYYALKEMTQTTIVDPKLSIEKKDGYWAIDTRENLPTPRWVNSITGIGFGGTDNNSDGYSSGSISVGALIDSELGWIKYNYRGKVCYTPVKPICAQLCWNDIAKREIMYGERTFRGVGRQMYVIRLMKEDEYTSLIPALMDGSLANYSKTDLGLLNSTTSTTARLTWLEDFQEGSLRKVGDHTGKNIYQTDPKTRVGIVDTVSGVTKWEMAYRPVLEFITHEDERWRNWPICTEVPNEKFIYDKFTDTGYFGKIQEDTFITANNYYLASGMTAGGDYNTGSYWNKFYWHGTVYYLTEKIRRLNAAGVNLGNCGIVYPFDTGDRLVRSIEIDNVVYNPCQPKAFRYQPIISGGNTRANPYGAYDHRTELIYRVTASTYNPTAGMTKYWASYNSNTTYTSYPQIGDNFVSDDKLFNWATVSSSDGPDIGFEWYGGNAFIWWDPCYGNLGYTSLTIAWHGGRGAYYCMLKYSKPNHIWLESKKKKDVVYVAKSRDDYIKELEDRIAAEELVKQNVNIFFNNNFTNIYISMYIYNTWENRVIGSGETTFGGDDKYGVYIVSCYGRQLVTYWFGVPVLNYKTVGVYGNNLVDTFTYSLNFDSTNNVLTLYATFQAITGNYQDGSKYVAYHNLSATATYSQKGTVDVSFVSGNNTNNRGASHRVITNGLNFNSPTFGATIAYNDQLILNLLSPLKNKRLQSEINADIVAVTK